LFCIGIVIVPINYPSGPTNEYTKGGTKLWHQVMLVIVMPRQFPPWLKSRKYW